MLSSFMQTQSAKSCARTHRVANARHRGFTLVELLVVIAIMIVLGTLIFAGVRMARSKAEAVVGLNNMKGNYNAIIAYTTDNNSLLPSCHAGISPIYRNSTQSYTYHIAPYLGYANPKEGDYMPEFGASGNWKLHTQSAKPPGYIVFHKINTGSEALKGRLIWKPTTYRYTFGYPGTRDPISLSAVQASGSNLSSCIVLTDMDQLHPDLDTSQPSWKNEIPAGLARGNYRFALYWDGHVGKTDKDLNPL